jgi:outer membrane protein TolC
MRARYVASAVILILFPLFGSYAEEMNLDVDTAVSLAIENNLGLQSDRIDMRTAKRAVSNGWNEFLPGVDLGVGLSYSDRGLSGDTFSSESAPWDLSTSISARLPLSRSNLYTIRDARLAFEAEDISLEDAKRLLERDVKKDFFNLIVLKERVALIDHDISIWKGRFDRARINYEKGLVSELSVLRQQVTLENYKIDREEAVVNYETAEMQFKQKLGLGRDVDIAPVGSLEMETDALLDRLRIEERIPDRFDVRAVVKNIEILENEKRLTRAEEFDPVLSLSYSYSMTLVDPFNADWGIADNWSRGSTVGIALSLPLDPLVPGSSGRLQVKEIDDSIEKARIELTETRQLAEIEISSTLLKIDKSLRTIEALKKNVALAEKTYRLTEQEYETGLTELSVLEDAYDDLQQARLSILEERYGYLEALFDLEYELNMRFPMGTGSSG